MLVFHFEIHLLWFLCEVDIIIIGCVTQSLFQTAVVEISPYFKLLELIRFNWI